MKNVAILIGQINYLSQSNLDCCEADVSAMEVLIRATTKYEIVERIQDADAMTLKQKLRSIMEEASDVGEIFFYFTGHGFQNSDDFFFCPSDFESSRPHETGFANEELHQLLRGAKPATVIKVIDACASGKRLIKSDEVFRHQPEGFKNFIQMASCLESQNSLTGSPLSPFTHAFRKAVVKQETGPVYYTDIVSRLRDHFIDSVDQVPHFVQQATGREQFVSDASLLTTVQEEPDSSELILQADEIVTSQQPMSMVEKLRALDERCATQEMADRLIRSISDGVFRETNADGALAEFYAVNASETEYYSNDCDDEYIVRVLDKQVRPDNLVTVATTKRRVKRPSIGLPIYLMSFYGEEYETQTIYNVTLNCSLAVAQLTVELVPKFRCLSQVRAVVSFAPSLLKCYIFESHSIQPTNDWNGERDTVETVHRRWFEQEWADDGTGIAQKICTRLKELANQTIRQVESEFNV